MTPTQHLEQLLNEDSLLLSKLLAAIAEERLAMEARKIEKLQPITENKNTLLNELRERARIRIRALVGIGYRPDKGHPGDYVLALGIPGLSSSWQTAASLLKEVHFQNEINGRVIGHLQRRLSRITDIVRGTAQQPRLYGAHGQERAISHSSILASA